MPRLRVPPDPAARPPGPVPRAADPAPPRRKRSVDLM